MFKDQGIEKKFDHCIREVKDKLTQKDLEFIQTEIACNEAGIAYEHLCVQLFEYAAPISQHLYDELAEIGKAMTIKDTYWLRLKHLITNDIKTPSA